MYGSGLILGILLLLMLPFPVHAQAQCVDLLVTGGNNRFVPSTVSFSVRASQPVPQYTMYFGDGQKISTSSSEISHTYNVSGGYTAHADIDNSTCQVIFSLLESPLESQKSGCSDVFITDGNSHPAGTDVRFLVTGYENKSGIRSYKLDFGNGQVKTNNVGDFDLTFPTPGTYTIKGFITDSKGVEKGGTDSCQVPLYITGAPIATQPATGTPTWFTIAGLLAGILLFLQWRNAHS